MPTNSIHSQVLGHSRAVTSQPSLSIISFRAGIASRAASGFSSAYSRFNFAIEGAEPGDALAVTIVDIEPASTGVTLIAPGYCFLRDSFPNPAVLHWKLTREHASCERLPGVRVPISAFPGSIGVLPDAQILSQALKREAALHAAGGPALLPDITSAVPTSLFGANGPYRDEGLRTIPPREFGGNLDTRSLTTGSTLLLPVFISGAGLWCGDVHFAQGDGEVCGSAIEMAARVSVRCEIRKGAGRKLSGPAVEALRPANAARRTFAGSSAPTERP